MNIYEQRSRDSYNQKADHYDESPEGVYTERFKQLLLKEVRFPQGGRVLDVACGNGRLLQRLSLTRSMAGYGVDISERMVANAVRMNPTMVFKTAGCAALPFENDFFDALTVCAAFHHFPDVTAFAGEARRVLKPGGRLYIADVYYPDWLRIICNPFVKFSPAGDVKFYAPREVQDLLSKAGFANESLLIEGTIQLLSSRKV
ncbi:MAG: methyltransferase domain-containing protein [Anaerolineae bacterium]|nr:methyltransferase domain-containing protein [Anaerolineae bacterium]